MSRNPKNIAIIGASGAIGSAFVSVLTERYSGAKIWGFSREGAHDIDYSCEKNIRDAAQLASEERPLDLVIIATGILHEKGVMPEKSLSELSQERFHRAFEVNAIVPAMIAKYFLPKLNKKQVSICAILSARVGSISDNRLGGWYAYRASKAALNMIITNAAIEMARVNTQAVIVGLHPGTVDSQLSKPFQSNIAPGHLLTPEYSAKKLIDVLESLLPCQTGKFFSWEGKEIFP